MDLKDLYRDVIIDHNRSPRNFGRLEGPDAHAEGVNPLCGDQLDLYVALEGDRLRDLKFEGKGCAISVASASLMTEALKGRTREEARRYFDEVHALLTRPGFTPSFDIGKLAALSGVREFPVRVKCASLCWHTLNAALTNSDRPVSTE